MEFIRNQLEISLFITKKCKQFLKALIEDCQSKNFDHIITTSIVSKRLVHMGVLTMVHFMYEKNGDKKECKDFLMMELEKTFEEAWQEKEGEIIQ